MRLRRSRRALLNPPLWQSSSGNHGTTAPAKEVRLQQEPTHMHARTGPCSSRGPASPQPVEPKINLAEAHAPQMGRGYEASLARL